MRIVDERDVVVPVVTACVAVAVNRAPLCRWRRPAPRPSAQVTRARTPRPRRLGDAERQAILDARHGAEFADQPPTEMYATLRGRGTYPHSHLRW